MQWVILTTFSLVPGIAWVWFFYRQDSADREPLLLLARTFICGMLSVLPAAWLEMSLSDVLLAQANPLFHLIILIVCIGFVEEFAKFAAFYVSVYRSDAFNEPLDGIIYAVTAAIGFATVENLLYAQTFGLSVMLVRALVTSLAHASFSGLVGYYVGMVRCGKQPRLVAVYALGTAAVLHGLYNFIIVRNELPAWLALPMVYFIYRFLALKIRQARTVSPF